MAIPADVQGLVAAEPARPRRPQVDAVLGAAVVCLVAFGLVATYTASYWIQDTNGILGTAYLRRQLAWTIIGTVGLAVALSIDLRSLRAYSVRIMAATLAMLLVMLVAGSEKFGGTRWLTAGGSIQPSEVAKLAVILYIADWLPGKKKDLATVSMGLLPFALLTGLVCGLILLQRHLSAAIVIGIVAVAMFFTAGAPLRHLLYASLVAAAVLAGQVVTVPYRMARVRSYLSPGADPTGSDFQVIQALEAIGRGGLLGVGLGNGQEKLGIPAPHTDAIFAVIGEELGLVGALALLALFAVVAWRGFRTAGALADPFGSLLALGITCWLAVQVAINVAVVTRLLPFTGVTLPFVSYGGSSLVSCLVATGLLLNLSRQVDPGRTSHAHMGLRRRDRRSHLSRSRRARGGRQ